MEKNGSGKKIIGGILFGCALLLCVAALVYVGTRRPEIIFPAISQEKTQVLFLGDSNIDFSFGGTKIPNMFEEKTGYVAYNAAIGGTCAANTSKYISNSNYYTLLSFFNLTKMMEAGDFSAMIRNRDTVNNSNSNLREKHTVLTHLDYSVMDYVVIHYGLNDYYCGTLIKGEDPYDENTYEGALRAGIEQVHKSCPDAVIILSSITYTRYETGDGNTASGYELDFGGGTIEAYRDGMKKISEEYPYTVFLDNLSGMGIGDENYSEEGYYHDAMHFDEKAREIYTEGLVDLIRSMEEE